MALTRSLHGMTERHPRRLSRCSAGVTGLPYRRTTIGEVQQLDRRIPDARGDRRCRRDGRGCLTDVTRYRLKSRRELQATFLARHDVLRFFDAWWAAALGVIILLCLLFPPLRRDSAVSAAAGIVVVLGMAYHVFMPVRLL